MCRACTDYLVYLVILIYKEAPNYFSETLLTLRQRLLPVPALLQACLSVEACCNLFCKTDGKGEVSDSLRVPIRSLWDTSQLTDSGLRLPKQTRLHFKYIAGLLGNPLLCSLSLSRTHTCTHTHSVAISLPRRWTSIFLRVPTHAFRWQHNA